MDLPRPTLLFRAIVLGFIFLASFLPCLYNITDWLANYFGIAKFLGVPDLLNIDKNFTTDSVFVQKHQSRKTTTDASISTASFNG